MENRAESGEGSPFWQAAGRDALLAALAFQLDCGADEPIAETPCDRFAESEAELARRAAQAEAAAAGAGPAPGGAARSRPPSPRAAPPGAGPAARGPGGAEQPPKEAAREAAAAATTLEALHEAIRGFDGSPLKKGARNTVICDGHPQARVMIVGEAPGRDEDRLGKPFVGRSGQLLDLMLKAIGLDRASAEPATGCYITNVVYWRPIENRRPSGDEVAMLAPFLERHIQLAKPEFLVLMGASPAQALLETTMGITRLRGSWRLWNGVPCLPTFHPAYLLRQPDKKRESWRDLLSLRAALDGAKPWEDGR
ncbi:uracil-DNA glycosylase [Albimonas sp. CAU 1670]|uniref:uracil-DNA glycosylase n=1 Tax=Albimonas sp. CAU 1670 TaxID=3032599 RepID=UPI0023DB6A9C|nr:uracil-DNA glycosylase [Albimonas sp. CAU 1670]MDF2234514.1 uracil-DNA glycosylase [Albimonas sp. CAU 1670]